MNMCKDAAGQTEAKILSMQVDVSNVASLEPAMRQTAEALGGLDILVNAAGVNKPVPALDVTEEAWDRIMDINLKGMFFTAQAFARIRLGTTPAGGLPPTSARIINISSSLSHSVLPDRVPYLASKGGVNLLTKALALEWASLGITVNAVGPAIVDTDMTRSMGSNQAVHSKMLLGRLIRADEIGAATLFLASEGAAMITGQVLFVDAGWTIH